MTGKRSRNDSHSNSQASNNTWHESTPYYGKEGYNLKRMLDVANLSSTSDPTTSLLSIMSPFFTNTEVADEIIENKKHGVQQHVYVSPHALHPQHGKLQIDRLHSAGVPVYIVPKLHTKAVHQQWKDTTGSIQTKHVTGTANVTYNGMYNNYGDSWMKLPQDVSQDVTSDLDYIHGHSTPYTEYDTHNQPATPPRKSPRTVYNRTPYKKLCNTLKHDVSEQIKESIDNTQAGDTITFGTYAIDDRICIQALQRAKDRGVQVSGYVDANARLPQEAQNLPMYRVHTGPSTTIYHDKTISIQRKNADNTVIYKTGNATTRSNTEINHALITKTPRSTKSIMHSFHQHLRTIQRDAKNPKKSLTFT